MNLNLNLDINLDKYLGIIFDLDGTLINSMGAHEDPWQQTCEYFALPFRCRLGLQARWHALTQGRGRDR